MSDPRTMQREADTIRRGGHRIAVVPTMGALHAGHGTLIRTARKRADVVVTTVFVNPAQFGRGEDFERYPRDPAKDAAIAEDEGTDILFTPDVPAMYGVDFQTFVVVEKVSLPLEGAVRPGHFRGVATVVAKLFNITKPHLAVFGQKDAQQVAVIRRMMRDLDFDIELLVVPTVREADGLALSSRNIYLTPAQRREAPVLYATLCACEESIRRGERSAAALIAAARTMIGSRSSAVVDYYSVTDAATLQEVVTLVTGQQILISLAVRFGSTRLIDNIQLTI